MARNGRYRACLSDSTVLIVERTMKGVLVTTLDRTAGVLDQEYLKGADVSSVLGSKLPGFAIETVHDMPKTTLGKRCAGCGMLLARELESADPGVLDDVPVVPIFRCSACGKRHYSVTREYLGKLVDRNEGLFSEEDMKELRKDREKGINMLNEYIIRIFASKKISRIQ